MATLDEALSFARQGVRIFAVHYIQEDGECDCGRPACPDKGKHPQFHKQDLKNGCLDATTDEQTITRWWKRWPNSNIGIATGSINDLGVLDIDAGEGKNGLESFKKLFPGVDLDEMLKSTLVAKTGGGGYHLYYKLNGLKLPNRRNMGEKGSDIDFRAEGGYVLGPPSNHKSGDTYQWITKREPIEIPLAVRELVQETEVVDEDSLFGKPPVTAQDYKTVVNDGEGRDSYLIRMAGKFARDGLKGPEIANLIMALNHQNVRPPKTKRDIIRITKSALKMEERRKRGLAYEVEREPKENGVRPFTMSFLRYMEEYGSRSTEWAIQDWLPMHTCAFVVAPPGSWKTWITIDLMLSIATGRPFLGIYPVKHTCPIIYVQQEDDHTNLAKRFAKIMNIGPVETVGEKHWRVPMPPYMDPPIYPHVERELTMKNPASIARLEKEIRRRKAGLVVMDPLYSMLEMQDYGATSARELLVFKSMRDVLDCSFMIVHHARKGEDNGGRLRDSAWGSVFLNAWIETGWQMRQKEGEGNVKIQRHTKIESELPLLDAQFIVDKWGYRVKVEETKSKEEDPLYRVAVAVSDYDIASIRELMERARITSSSQAQKLIKQLNVTKQNRYFKLPQSKLKELQQE